MAVEFRDSADKHGIPREDTMHAIREAAEEVELGDGIHAGEVNVLWIGHPHPQADRYLEVIGALNRKRRSLIYFPLHGTQ